MKKILSLFITMGFGLTAFAQGAEVQAKSFMDDPFSSPLLPLYALLAMIGLVIILILVVALSMIRVLNTLAEKAEIERAEKQGVVYKPKPSFWSQFAQSMNASVPLEKEKSIELDHEYDGIKELDNHLPPWWKYLFYGTIVWAGFYIAVYHFTGSLPLQIDEYQDEVSKAEEQKKQFLASQPKVNIDENTLTYSNDAAIITKGKEIYSINCSPCHKPDGGGSIGPNLTDEYWLHGGDIKNIFAVIKNGVPEKGMVSWAGVLSPEQLRDVSFFVMSLKGSNPPAAKAAQGDLFQAAPAEVKADSTATQASL